MPLRRRAFLGSAAAAIALNFNWRDYDPEETLRFHALRLADVKLLKKTPSRIISEGTDFAFFRQMQKELKA